MSLPPPPSSAVLLFLFLFAGVSSTSSDGHNGEGEETHLVPGSVLASASASTYNASDHYFWVEFG